MPYTVNISSSHMAGSLGRYFQHIRRYRFEPTPRLGGIQGKSGKDHVAKDNLTEERGERGFTPSNPPFWKRCIRVIPSDPNVNENLFLPS